jgi:probable phosphoglycerate mutase
MPLFLLIRHGENDYVKTGKMAGHIQGVHLNERGRNQAQELAQALSKVPLKAVYSSPLERAVETAQPLLEGRRLKMQIRTDLMDNDIGKWQGRTLKSVARNKSWRLVQMAPSRFKFPEGESFMQTQTRVTGCLDEIAARHKPRDVVAVVFHADPIKMAVAHYLGLPLDRFQRLGCDPGSMTILHLTEGSAHLLRLNQRPPFELEFHKPGRRKKRR